MYVKVDTSHNNVVEGPMMLPAAWQGISGFNRLPEKELRAYGWYPYEAGKVPVFSERTQRVSWKVEIKNGKAFSVPVVTLLPLFIRNLRFKEAKESLRQESAALRWAAQNAGVLYKEKTFHSDRDTVLALLIASAGEENETWKTKDGSWVMLSPLEMTELQEKIKIHIRACFQKEAEVAQRIEVASDWPELDAIDIEGEWHG